MNMQQQQQHNRDISKVFQTIRTKLNEKEKELLELQRANPCLSAPDYQQITKILDLISSLDLITQDGSFSFQSNSNENSSSNCTSICSTDIHSIKTLPSTNWLSTTNYQNQHRLPMVSHLLSLPINAYVQSNSSRLSTVDELFSKPISDFVQPKTTVEENSLRLPMVDELLSKPISAYVQPKTTVEESSLRLPIVDELLSKPIDSFTSKINEENVRETPKSLLDNQSVYSKEHWIKSKSTNDDQSDFVHINLDEYIEQSSDKLRRLHLEYLQAMEKLKTPIESNNSNTNIQDIYPQIFQRNKQDLSTKK